MSQTLFLINMSLLNGVFISFSVLGKTHSLRYVCVYVCVIVRQIDRQTPLMSPQLQGEEGKVWWGMWGPCLHVLALLDKIQHATE